jgi:hypothetical protein
MLNNFEIVMSYARQTVHFTMRNSELKQNRRETGNGC